MLEAANQFETIQHTNNCPSSLAQNSFRRQIFDQHKINRFYHAIAKGAKLPQTYLYHRIKS
jgi:hypothetical protein